MADVGFYAACWTLASGLFFIAGPVTQAWYPRMTDLWGRGQVGELSRLFHVGAQTIAVLVGSVTMVLVVFGPEITALWLGPGANAPFWGRVLEVLLLGTLCNCLVQLPYYGQLSAGWTSLAASANALVLPIFIPLVLWGVLHFGVMAAAVGWLAINLGKLLVVAPMTFKRVMKGQRRSWITRDVLMPIGAITVVGVVTNIVANLESSMWTVGIAAVSGTLALAVGTASADSLLPVVKCRVMRLAN